MFPQRRWVRQPTHCSVSGSPWRHGGSMFVSARNTAITSSVGGSLEDYSSLAQQHSWTTMTARWQHGCLWQEPCMDVSMMKLSRRRTLEGKNREEGNGKPPRLFSLDMIPINGRCSSTSTAACRQLSTAASRMSCSSGLCSSSSTATCQVMGVIDLLLKTAEYQKKKKKKRLTMEQHNRKSTRHIKKLDSNNEPTTEQQVTVKCALMENMATEQKNQKLHPLN